MAVKNTKSKNLTRNLKHLRKIIDKFLIRRFVEAAGRARLGD